MPSTADATVSCRPVAEGRLVLVGCGLQPSRHASPRTVSEISGAGVVFALADPFAIDWLRGLNSDVRNLSEHYSYDRDRRESYRDMQRDIAVAVRAGHRVCVAFYGHPGVFAQVGRKALARARAEGFKTAMEPGISAEACLYADLDLDPGEYGVQSIEATQLLIEQRVIDPSALLLVWQVMHAGNLACTGFEAHPDRLELLVKKLERWYRAETGVILYEAATLPIQDHRAERLTLGELPRASLTEVTTLVIPPVATAAADAGMLACLRVID